MIQKCPSENQLLFHDISLIKLAASFSWYFVGENSYGGFGLGT